MAAPSATRPRVRMPMGLFIRSRLMPMIMPTAAAQPSRTMVSSSCVSTAPRLEHPGIRQRFPAAYVPLRLPTRLRPEPHHGHIRAVRSLRWRVVELAQAKAASELLIRHWREGTTLTALPPPLQPETRADAYLIQSHLASLSAKPLFGWKIAATSLAGQRHIAVDGPLAGRLLAEMVYPDGASLPFGANHMRVAEAEFAFRMSGDLPPQAAPYSQSEVLAAVAALHLAIEVPDSRYTDFTLVGAAQL